MIHDLAFVQLTVADWPQSVAWYRDVLGLEVVQCAEADRFALFCAGSSKLALKSGQPLAGNVLLTFETANLDAAVAALTERGVALTAPVKTSQEGYRRVLLHDPDGHALCLFEWLKGSGKSG